MDKVSVLRAACYAIVLGGLGCGNNGVDTAASTAPTAGATTTAAPTTLPSSAGATASAAGVGSPARPATTVAVGGNPASGGSGAMAAVGGTSAAPSAGTGGVGVASAAGAASVAGASAAAGSGGVGAAGSSAGAGGASVGGAAGSCDRQCLLGFMQMYIDALIAHDPSKLPVSDKLKYTEQGEKAKLGDAVWKTFSKPIDKSRLDFADPVLMNVGTQLGFYESGNALVRYGLRLKIESMKITEIESMATRSGDHFAFSADNLEPKPIFLQKPSKPNTREELLAITNLYADYLEGKKRGNELPFAEDCTRYENGVPLAQGKASFELQSWSFKVTPRRILIIDEEQGITWGNLPFYSDGLDEPLIVGEAFKIDAGQFKMIQAVMRYQNNKEWE